jgi:group II intron reverse transcriptase/maturase
LWEAFLSRGNLARALRRVERNAGAAGIDGMRTDRLRPWLDEDWPQVRARLEAGTYRPQPVRRVAIPKPSGGTRLVGVPTALDRLIQQALLQVLTAVFDPYFSEHSFGFRPGRSAQQAVGRARQSIADGAAWVVDVDLDGFFDRVQQDALLARVARRVGDKQVLRLLRPTWRRASWRTGSGRRARRGRRKARRSRRCWRTSCSTTSTRSWTGAGTASSATPTT